MITLRPLLLSLTLLPSACAHDVVRGPASCAEAAPDRFDTQARGADFGVSGDGFRIGLHQHGRDASLVIAWSMRGAAGMHIARGSLIELALGNGVTMTVATSLDAAPVMQAGGYNGWTRTLDSYTTWVTEAQLGADELQVLADTPITAARVHADAIGLTITLSPYTQVDLQTIAVCYAGPY